MVPTGDSRLSNAPLVPLEEEQYRPRTTPAPQVNISCHLLSDSFTLEATQSFSFIFDSLTDCCITITSEGTHPNKSRKTFTFPAGIDQLFTGWPLDFSQRPADTAFDNTRGIEMHIKLESAAPVQHSEVSVVSFRKVGEGYQGKITMQKLEYRGKVYELKEIFGDVQEERLECAICLFNKRDTVIIPCYHMCLCSSCGNMLRAQTSKKCPMCRCGK